MLYSSLPWPSWRPALAPDYTILMPVNTRSERAYDAAVPTRPGNARAPENANERLPAAPARGSTQQESVTNPLQNQHETNAGEIELSQPRITSNDQQSHRQSNTRVDDNSDGDNIISRNRRVLRDSNRAGGYAPLNVSDHD